MSLTNLRKRKPKEKEKKNQPHVAEARQQIVFIQGLVLSYNKCKRTTAFLVQHQNKHLAVNFTRNKLN